MSPRRLAQRKRWVEETQMFQRIAGTPLSSQAELEADWDSLYTRKPLDTCKAAADNAEAQRIILEVAGQK